MSTAMAEAFSRSGYQDPREVKWQLALDVAVAAWMKWPAPSAGGTRRDHVRAHFKNDPTWIVFERLYPEPLAVVVGLLLKRADEMTAAQRAKQNPAKAGAGAGHVSIGNHMPNARSGDTITNAGKPAGREGHAAVGAHSSHALPASPDGDRPQAESQERMADCPASPIPVPPSAPTLTSAAISKLAAYATLSRLDTVLIDGKPIGDCTVSQVKDWAAKRQTDARHACRDVRFALALVGTLPSSETIREWWTNPAEVDAIYAKAEAEYAA